MRSNQVVTRPETERHSKWFRDRKSGWAVSVVGPRSREQSTCTADKVSQGLHVTPDSTVELCWGGCLPSWDLHLPYSHIHPRNQPLLFEVFRQNLCCLQRHKFINPRSPSELNRSRQKQTQSVCKDCWHHQKQSQTEAAKSLWQGKDRTIFFWGLKYPLAWLSHPFTLLVKGRTIKD